MNNFDRAKALFYEGVTCLEREEYAQAEAKLRSALELVPDRVSTMTNLSSALLKLQQPQAAKALLLKAIDLDAASAESWVNLGLLELEGANAIEAINCFDHAIRLDAACAEAWMGKGVACNKLKRHDDALTHYAQAIKLKPDYAGAYNNRGITLSELKRWDDALASYALAITLKPALAGSHNNRGLALQALGRLDEALASYAQAITLKPAYAEAHCNRGLVLQELERRAEALACFEHALKIKPDSLDAKTNIFLHHLAELANPPLIEKWAAAMAAADLNREPDEPGANQSMPDFRVLHELEQTAYLLALGTASTGLREANSRLKDIQARTPAPQENSTDIATIALAAEEAADIHRFRKYLPRYAVPATLTSCLNPDNDWPAIEAQYFSSVPEIVCIDNLLSAQALLELRKFCLYSPVWKREYRNKYLGAFAKDGFISPLHVQIAVELQQKMPRIFGGHRLEQLWGFKYSPKMETGIGVHADFARVNLNFWITPDEANLDAASGGLLVYDKPAPSSWSFQDYNRNEKAVYEFLDKNHAGSRRIPYRCNRAVLFNSNLFHETDKIHFKEGFENRRINITYLFGKGLKTQ